MNDRARFFLLACVWGLVAFVVPDDGPLLDRFRVVASTYLSAASFAAMWWERGPANPGITRHEIPPPIV